MSHFRDAKAGKFYLHDRSERVPDVPSEVPPFLRFAHKHGVALDLWHGDSATAHDLLDGAQLAWPVMRREMLVPAGPGISEPTIAAHYEALVRPDTEQIMSVVTTAYRVAENHWVANAVEKYATRLGSQPPMLAAAGFGRAGERTMFAARVMGDENEALCLLAHNTHGGEGAVRFELVEVDRRVGVTYVLDSPHASMSFSHVGDIEDRLDRASRSTVGDTFIERYLTETRPLWKRLSDALWTPRHTTALIRDLWGETPSATSRLQGRTETMSEVESRHPGHHLPHRMQDCTDALHAYQAVCDWIDNLSEACERGDFTKDRDERLALGAGNKYKRDAWRWILTNT